MKLLQRLIAIVCIFGATSVHAAEEPIGKAKDAAASPQEGLPENVALVKGFIVTGTLTKVIGTFSTYGIPQIGDTFEIDLANLPKEMFRFTRTTSDPRKETSSSYIPFSAPLTIEEVRLIGSVTTAINLSAIDAHGKFLIQVHADKLEKGSKVRIRFYKGNSAFIGSMAEAEGALK